LGIEKKKPSKMASTRPTTGPQPLPQRLIALAQTLQFGWFVGHLTLLLTTLRYTISFIKFNTSTTTAAVSYRLAFLSAAVTYGIVVYKAYRARIKQAGADRLALQQHLMAMAGDENVQYLIMALIWLVSKPIYLALLPFTIYSTFHFLTYLRTALIPAVIPPPTTPQYPAGSSATGTAPPPGSKPKSTTPNALGDAISKFVKSHYDTSMAIVANLEIALFVRLFFGCLIWVNSWILLIIYAVFLRIRVGQSPFVRQALTTTEVRIDGLIADQRVPPAARGVWANLKDGIRRVGQVTDIGDLTGGKVGAGAARKTQ